MLCLMRCCFQALVAGRSLQGNRLERLLQLGDQLSTALDSWQQFTTDELYKLLNVDVQAQALKHTQQQQKQQASSLPAQASSSSSSAAVAAATSSGDVATRSSSSTYLDLLSGDMLPSSSGNNPFLRSGSNSSIPSSSARAVTNTVPVATPPQAQHTQQSVQQPARSQAAAIGPLPNNLQSHGIDLLSGSFDPFLQSSSQQHQAQAVAAGDTGSSDDSSTGYSLSNPFVGVDASVLAAQLAGMPAAAAADNNINSMPMIGSLPATAAAAAAGVRSAGTATAALQSPASTSMSVSSSPKVMPDAAASNNPFITSQLRNGGTLNHPASPHQYVSSRPSLRSVSTHSTDSGTSSTIHTTAFDPFAEDHRLQQQQQQQQAGGTFQGTHASGQHVSAATATKRAPPPPPTQTSAPADVQNQLMRSSIAASVTHRTNTHPIAAATSRVQTVSAPPSSSSSPRAPAVPASGSAASAQAGGVRSSNAVLPALGSTSDAGVSSAAAPPTHHDLPYWQEQLISSVTRLKAETLTSCCRACGMPQGQQVMAVMQGLLAAMHKDHERVVQSLQQQNQAEIADIKATAVKKIKEVLQKQQGTAAPT